jgi:hypothetical protein
MNAAKGLGRVGAMLSALAALLLHLFACSSDPPGRTARTPSTIDVAPREAGPSIHVESVAPPPPPAAAAETFPTYEEALAKEPPPAEDDPSVPLTDAQLAAPMRNATFISKCGAPDPMKVTVSVAVRDGKAVGVSVSTDPSDPKVATCVDRYVRALVWTRSPKLASFTTTY